MYLKAVWDRKRIFMFLERRGLLIQKYHSQKMVLLIQDSLQLLHEVSALSVSIKNKEIPSLTSLVGIYAIVDQSLGHAVG